MSLITLIRSRTPMRKTSVDFFELPLSTVESEEQLKEWLEEGLVRKAGQLQKQGDFKEALNAFENLKSPHPLLNTAMVANISCL